MIIRCYILWVRKDRNRERVFFSFKFKRFLHLSEPAGNPFSFSIQVLYEDSIIISSVHVEANGFYFCKFGFLIFSFSSSFSFSAEFARPTRWTNIWSWSSWKRSATRTWTLSRGRPRSSRCPDCSPGSARKSFRKLTAANKAFIF